MRRRQEKLALLMAPALRTALQEQLGPTHEALALLLKGVDRLLEPTPPEPLLPEIRELVVEVLQTLQPPPEQALRDLLSESSTPPSLPRSSGS